MKPKPVDECKSVMTTNNNGVTSIAFVDYSDFQMQITSATVESQVTNSIQSMSFSTVPVNVTSYRKCVLQTRPVAFGNLLGSMSHQISKSLI